jgi:hypothetical protein
MRVAVGVGGPPARLPPCHSAASASICSRPRPHFQRPPFTRGSPLPACPPLLPTPHDPLRSARSPAPHAFTHGP